MHKYKKNCTKLKKINYYVKHSTKKTIFYLIKYFLFLNKNLKQLKLL